MIHKRTTHFVVGLGVALILCCANLFSQIPRTLSYQGVITGNNLPNGTRTVIFRLYTQSAGGGAIWTETQNVKFTSGVFSVILGEEVPFADSVRFDRQYWLGIQLPPKVEMIPRVKLTSTAYSLNSSHADTAEVAVSSGPPSRPISPPISNGEIADRAVSLSKLDTSGAQQNQVITFAGNSITWGTPSGEGGLSLPFSGQATAGGFEQAALSVSNLATSGANYGILGSNSSSGGTGVSGISPNFGVSGIASASTGVTYGVFGSTASQSDYAAGVSGFTSGSNRISYGVSGTTNSQGSYSAGVNGRASNGIGLVYGVSGLTISQTDFAAGVNGLASGANGVTYGVSGGTNSETDHASGVFGRANGFTGVTYGVMGLTASISTSAAGVYGEGGSANGVYGHTNNTNASGVFGVNDVSGYGVLGLSNSGFAGVYGTGGQNGVYGYSANSTTSGVFGLAEGGWGVAGLSGSGFAGVLGSGAQNGVYGLSSNSTASGVYGNNSGGGFGVFGSSATTGSPYGFLGGQFDAGYGPFGAGVVGISGSGGVCVVGFNTEQGGNAGVFYGSVGVIGGPLYGDDKLFRIDHPLDPLNKYLQHSCVESNERMDVYNGNVTSDANGEATVSLPDYFEALNNNFRYQLTVIGQFAQAIVSEEIHDNQFKVRTDKPNVKVSWQVTGVRQDAYAKAHPLEVEKGKVGGERGKYMSPESYGLPRYPHSSFDTLTKGPGSLPTMPASNIVTRPATLVPNMQPPQENQMPKSSIKEDKQ